MTFWLYLADLLSNLKVTIFIILIIGTIIYLVDWIIRYDEICEVKNRKKRRKIISIFLILAITETLIPSEKTMCLMIRKNFYKIKPKKNMDNFMFQETYQNKQKN